MLPPGSLQLQRARGEDLLQVEHPGRQALLVRVAGDRLQHMAAGLHAVREGVLGGDGAARLQRQPAQAKEHVGLLAGARMRWKRTPGGGWKPVAPPWLRSSVRSMYQIRSSGATPNSCCITPRVHSAAVCWYSGTPTRLPLRSAGCSTPASVRTRKPVW